jgi:hypothetical protein
MSLAKIEIKWRILINTPNVKFDKISPVRVMLLHGGNRQTDIKLIIPIN